jgi:flagellin
MQRMSSERRWWLSIAHSPAVGGLARVSAWGSRRERAASRLSLDARLKLSGGLTIQAVADTKSVRDLIKQRHQGDERMSLTINTNLEAMNASRNLNNTEDMLSQTMQRLSSGLRVNTAADDVAGYAISQSLQAQVNGLNQAGQNIQDAVALAQTAQGALNDINTMLQRVRQLGVEYLNGTTSEEDKEAISAETEQLVEEIKRVGETTQFNGVDLLKGEEEIKFQVGANDKETIGVKTIELYKEIEGIKGVLAAEKEPLKEIDEAINTVSKLAGEFGSVQDRIQFTQDNLEVYSQNLTSAVSAITDVNMATEMTNFTKDQVLQQAGVSILAQANQLPDATLKLLE